MKTVPGLSLDLPSGEVLPVLKRAMGLAPLSFVITDAEGVVVGSNRAFSRLTGTSGSGRAINLKEFIRANAPSVADLLEAV